MVTKDKSLRIVITGAESTGKTEIAKKLASHFNGILIPELAREYVETLDRHYSFDDVVQIAHQQISVEKELSDTSGIIIFDTWLILTKIWFQEVYQQVPYWVETYINAHPPDFFLVCENDLEWVYDPVRENKDKRDYLQALYISEIEKLGKPWCKIGGKGEQRTLNAIKTIETFLKDR
ncbi:MAG: ATP-binding protein [Bacteroidales bacterium]|nr:ATP-binding protein [Bacteroidales bacterium]MCF8455609.1 ATP-binding protein [Bacteroidales bacterium]